MTTQFPHSRSPRSSTPSAPARRALALLGVALGIALGGAAAAAPAGAQQAPPREFEVAAQRLREQVETLKSQRLQLDDAAGRVDVDSVLRAIGPQLERAMVAASRAQAQLVERYGSQVQTDAELNRLARELGQVQGLAQLELAQRARRLRSDAPTGYLGVSYSSSTRTVTRNGDVVVYHEDAPVVVSVEPGSPAERAGIRRGDTLVSYDGVVLRHQAISLGDVLKPGRTVAVGLRRAGEPRTVKVVVGRRPQAYVVGPQDASGPSYRIEYGTGVPFAVAMQLDPASAFSGTVVMPAPPASAQTRLRETTRWAPVAPPAPLSPAAPLPPPVTITTGPQMGAWVFGGTAIAIAGAQVVPLDDGWRDMLGVDDDGVVVVKVAAGTPAAAAGLRSGDVIMTADGNPVLTPAAFQRAVQASSDRSVSLGVVRKRANRTVVLKW